jgi:sodium/hydrogen exchanger 10/11
MLFHTAGIVILTLLVNATTVRYLLDTLGLSDISNARRLTMTTAIRRITEAKVKSMRLLKSDRFLADAHWEIVDRKTEIENPFESGGEEEEVCTSYMCLYLP